MKTCPRCKLINPPAAVRCDCGYAFASTQLDPAAAQHPDSGVRYVVFQYCISILVMTFRRPSKVYAIAPETSRLKLGLRYSLVSLLLGWWGIPWGPIWTIGSIVTNFQGGRDITQAVLAAKTRR